VNGMVQVTVPAWLVVSGLLSAGPAALVLMAMTLTMAVMGPLTGRASRVPYDRWYLTGMLACATGVGSLAIATGAGPWWLAPFALVIVGIGAGSLLSPSLTAFSHTDAGANTVGLSMFNMLRLSSFAIGGLIGGAALDRDAPWAAFAAAAAACGAAAGMTVLTRGRSGGSA
jgi:MFS family permease